MYELETKLALANVDAIAHGSVLMVGFPSADLAEALAARASRLTVFQQDLRAYRAVEHGGVEAHLGAWMPDAVLSSTRGLPAVDPVATALVLLPKEVDRLRMLLAMIRPLLLDDGRVVLIGHNDAGIRSADPYLRETIGDAAVLDYRFHCRALEARVGVEARPFDPSAWRVTWEDRPAGRDVTIVSFPGVFSHRRVDAATRMLLETIELPADARVLDVGCGSGVIGAWLALDGPGRTVTCVDTDAVAIRATGETFDRNGIGDRVVVRPSNVYSDVRETYTHIVSNPPFHAGVRTTHDVGRRLIEEAPDRLERGGELWLVANRFLDYLTPLQGRFGRVEVRAEDKRFRVYRARA